jgi:putative DNA-binding protein
MPAEVTLERVQRWMQAVLVHPGTLAEAVAGPEAAAELPPEHIGDVVLPSRTLTPTERVGIYQGMYLLRMEEALSTDFPGLKHFLGDEAFFELVRDYVQQYPSRHFSLNRLGDHFPDFVGAASGLRRPAFCEDLARLELAITHVFDAPETPPVSAETLAAVPAEDWERARLEPIAALRLVALRYPAGPYLDTLDDERHRHPAIRRRDNWWAVYRRDYTVWRKELTRAAHDLLTDLLAGKTLGEAVEAALRRSGRSRAREAQLFRWFREWAADGLVRSVRVD